MHKSLSVKLLRTTIPALFLLACTGGDIPEPTPEPKPDDSPKVVDLRSQIGAADVEVVGVTISPDTKKRYLLDSSRGIFELSEEGTAYLLIALEDFPDADELIQSEFTDIAAMGANRFALTALNEGYMLDLTANTLVRHFCYLPDVLQESGVYQMTHSVTFDARSGYIFAQPQTFSEQDDSVIASSIGRFAESNGEEQQWFALTDSDYIAGALSTTPDGHLALGNGNTLSLFNLDTNKLGSPISLVNYGVTDIVGMTIDAANEKILIVDGVSDKLIEVPLALLSQM